MPKVSIVVPTHNRSHFLKATIQSVLSQTFQDFEIIIVDDASVDGTDKVIQGFTDPRIRYIRHDINKGQGVTRNDGINQASGEYVALLDDDDEWLPKKLEKQVQLLDSSPATVGLIYTGLYRVEGVGKRIINEVIPHTRGNAFRQLCLGNSLGTCSTVLIRMACFEKIGLFDEELASSADYDMWLRISSEFEIDYIREPLVYYTVHHGDSISTNHESQIRGLESLLEKHASYFESDHQNYSRRYATLGISYCCAGKTQKGREALLRAIELYPFEVRHYYNLFLSLLGAHNFRRMRRLRDIVSRRLR